MERLISHLRSPGVPGSSVIIGGPPCAKRRVALKRIAATKSRCLISDVIVPRLQTRSVLSLGLDERSTAFPRLDSLPDDRQSYRDARRSMDRIPCPGTARSPPLDAPTLVDCFCSR